MARKTSTNRTAVVERMAISALISIVREHGDSMTYDELMKEMRETYDQATAEKAFRFALGKKKVKIQIDLNAR